MSVLKWRSFAGYNTLLLAVGAAALLIIVSAAFLYSGRTQREAGEALRDAATSNGRKS